MTVQMVVDTNIFISAIISKSGASRKVIRGCLERKYLPLMGNSLWFFTRWYAVKAGSLDLSFSKCNLHTKS